MNEDRRNMELLPNFLIVGTAKSAATTIHKYLKSQTNVFMTEWKESSFFVLIKVGLVYAVILFGLVETAIVSMTGTLFVNVASTIYVYKKLVVKNSYLIL